MIYAEKIFSDFGVIEIDSKVRTWRFSHAVKLTFYEKTETWSCDVLGDEVRVSYNDLRLRLMHKFRMGAQAEAREKYVEEMDLPNAAAQSLLDAQAKV